MSKRSRRQYQDDDGRVVANMNVEGMPGYRSDRTGDNASGPPPPPTRRETRSLMTNAVLAALLIGAVFLLAAGLLILFCTNVWLK